MKSRQLLSSQIIYNTLLTLLQTNPSKTIFTVMIMSNSGYHLEYEVTFRLFTHKKTFINKNK